MSHLQDSGTPLGASALLRPGVQKVTHGVCVTGNILHQLICLTQCHSGRTEGHVLTNTEIAPEANHYKILGSMLKISSPSAHLTSAHDRMRVVAPEPHRQQHRLTASQHQQFRRLRSHCEKKKLEKKLCPYHAVHYRRPHCLAGLVGRGKPHQPILSERCRPSQRLTCLLPIVNITLLTYLPGVSESRGYGVPQYAAGRSRKLLTVYPPI